MSVATRVQPRPANDGPERRTGMPSLQPVEGVKDRLEPAGEEEAVEAARRIYRLRRRRDASFGPELFSDPAWDILLVLFIARREDRPLSISHTCHAAAAPRSTALRWIRQLEQEGLIIRQGDRADGRRAYLRLSSRAAKKMRSLLKEACPGSIPGR